MRALLLLFAAPLGAFAAQPVWIDTDPSVARGGHEVDDGFALVQAFRSPALAVRGVSVVFGNAPLAEGMPIARRLAADFGPRGLAVFSGAAGAKDLGVETDASRALAAGLRRERMTVLALGPATNVATVLRNHPELGRRIKKIVAVAGRRRGQRFANLGSNRAFRDFNFELDPAAFQILLDSGVPLVLAPWEISSKVWIRAPDLDRLRKNSPSLGWILEAAGDWLSFWKTNLAADGFNPFDTLAVGYAISPRGFGCRKLPIRLEEHLDDTVSTPDPPRKPYLIVDRGNPSDRAALYCSEPPPGFAEHLFIMLKRDSK